MFNPEEPLAAIIRATGRDEQTLAKLMTDVVQDFRTPKLSTTPTFDPVLDMKHQYIQPLSNSVDDVTMHLTRGAEGVAENGMRMSVLDNAKGNLFQTHEGRWGDDPFWAPGPNRLTEFYRGPNQSEVLRGIPTAAIYDFVKPVTVADVPDVLRVTRGGTNVGWPHFVMEKLGKEPGTVDVLRFTSGDAADITLDRTGVPFSELPHVRSLYESSLGIPKFSDFNPISTKF